MQQIQQKAPNGGGSGSGVANNLAMVAASSAATAVATATNTTNTSNTAQGSEGAEGGGGEDGGGVDDDNLSQAKGLPIQMMITPGVSLRIKGRYLLIAILAIVFLEYLNVFKVPKP